MDSLNIRTGEKRIAINGDENRVIVFNPRDVLFAEKFYRLIAEFNDKLKVYQDRAKQIEKVTAVDADGLPVNIQERIDFMKDTCAYVREQIDNLFGKGTSNIAFGDAINLDMFTDFFEGLTPYIQEARQDKLKAYSNPPPATEKKRRHK